MGMPSGWGPAPRAAYEPVPASEGLGQDAAKSVTARYAEWRAVKGVAAPGDATHPIRAEAHQGLRKQTQKCALHIFKFYTRLRRLQTLDPRQN